MLEVADIVRLHGPAYRQQFGDRLTTIQKRALRDILHCRTPFFGGHVYTCAPCGRDVYAYHSCGNRHCPKCHREQSERWLDRQKARLLPCSYYLVTFTLPAQLRPLARAHPRIVYNLLLRSAARSLLQLANDPRYLGGRPACLAILHTWTRAMLYHPHVHILVSAGGLGPDGHWIPPRRRGFFVPVRALSPIFRAKMCDGLNRAGLLDHVPSKVWNTDWVVHCQPAGSGDAVLAYLGRYLFRVAIANSRIERIGDQVTFRYRDNRSRQIRPATLSGTEFLGRFLQHVLPRGLAKVRYYGLWSPSCRRQLDRLLSQLAPPSTSNSAEGSDSSPISGPPEHPSLRCPYCHAPTLILRGRIAPKRARAP
jgi:hypothetical protein